MAQQSYMAVLQPSCQGFELSFPDVPGCESAGLDANEALANGEQALMLHLARLAGEGEALPSARSINELAQVCPHPRPGSGVMWVRLTVPMHA